jgi:hypothetical protein
MIQNIKLLNLVEAFGPLDHSAAQAIALSVVSAHQLVQHDDFNVIILLADRALQLDAAAFNSVVDYLVKYYPDEPKTAHFLKVQQGVKIKPKPEPEVAACRPQAEPQPEPESEAISPRWKARIRTKLHGGFVHEEERLITDIDELERFVDHNPYYREDIKHIKIKLEPKF